MLSVGAGGGWVGGGDSIFQGEHLVLCRCLSALGDFSNVTCLQSIPTVFSWTQQTLGKQTDGDFKGHSFKERASHKV